jgi:hypothetical protein
LAVGALVVLTPPAAQAGTCSSKTGGSSNWVMWTGSGYTCAYQSKSDKKKIGSAATQSWTSSTAMGYTKRDHRWKQTGGVKVSYIYYGSNAGSSITFTAFNSEDGSRHWGAAVIWNTADGGKVKDGQYKGDDYEYKTNRFTVSKISVNGPTTTATNTPASYTVKVTDPDGGTTPAGTIALMKQAGSKPDPTTKDCDGKVTHQGTDSGIGQAVLSGGSGTLTTPALPDGSYKLYAVYAGSLDSKGRALYCNSPTQQGLTPVQSSTWTLTVAAPSPASSGAASDSWHLDAAPGPHAVNPTVASARGAGRAATGDKRSALSVVEHTFHAGAAGGASGRSMACPSGWAPVQVNASSPTAVLPENVLVRDGAKLGIRSGSVPSGTKVDVQVVCRRAGVGVWAHGKIVLGTTRADRLATTKAGTTVLAGRGNDRVVVRNRGSVAFGFAGADHIVVSVARGAAHGGAGNDVLTAQKPGAVVLVGGLGRDVLTGAKGRTLINARDGAGGDRVICRSSANIVLADPGDQIVGPCTVR